MFLFRNERFWWTATAIAGILPLLMVVLLGAYLLFHAAAAIWNISLQEFMTATWQPIGGRFGVLPLLSGTLAVTVMALLIAVPVGLCSAVYLAMFAGLRMRRVADTATGILGALPSVVIGLWGMTWLVPLFGNSLTSASLVAAMMIVPTFTLLSGAALRQVPASVDETVRALGVGDAVRTMVLLRHARRGIFRALTLATSRALGEAVAVYLVAGNIPAWPLPTGPVSTLTSTVISELDAAAGLHRSALHVLGLLVVVLIAVVSIAGRRNGSRCSEP